MELWKSVLLSSYGNQSLHQFNQLNQTSQETLDIFLKDATLANRKQLKQLVDFFVQDFPSNPQHWSKEYCHQFLLSNCILDT
tara:strand:+ start:187 stop:432 length:246 start_codon:yes stop_codon:yes gene_type:complete